MSHDAREHTGTYIELQQTEEFGELRRRFRRFVFPMTALFLAWYFLYVRWADREFDPRAEALHDRLEEGQR